MITDEYMDYCAKMKAWNDEFNKVIYDLCKGR